jgi:NAD-dependent SIR2 family protein deacetylase
MVKTPTLNSSQKLELAQFIRAVDINKTSTHSFFIGAGASVSSGIKSASDCIWEWKRQIFISSNPGLEKLFPDGSSHAAQRKIQEWLDTQNHYPQREAVNEYAFFASEAFPIPSTRKSFFQNISKDAKASAGYHLLCLLARDRVVRKIWTTNFDHLTSKAAASYSLTPIEIGLDSTHRVDRVAADGELIIYALHGDYRYDSLKNTAEELQSQDKVLRAKLVEDCRASHMIVLGFSGNDQSIMDALREAYSQKAAGTLYWCGYGDQPNTGVIELLNTAKMANREAYYVPTNGFDDLMMRLAKFCLSGESYNEAEPHFKRIDSLKNEFTPFDLKIDRIDSVIKSNLLPLTIPSELFQFSSPLSRQAGAWANIRSVTNQKNVVAAPLKQKILALGTMNDITNAFSGQIEGNLTRVPIDQSELNIDDGAIKHIITAAITIALASKLKLSCDQKRRIWSDTAIQEKVFGGVTHKVYQAIFLDVIKDDKGLFLLIKPTVEIVRADNEPVDKSVKQTISKDILDRMYNGQFNTAFEHWRGLIFEEQGAITLEFPTDSGSGFNFTIQETPLYAKIQKTSGNGSLTDNPKYYKFSGKQLDEPTLLFSSLDGKREVGDAHPLRGLVQNKPYDFSLTTAGLSKQTMLGVICPSTHSQKFSKFLNLQHGKVAVSNPKENYAIDFPGYTAAYGIALNIPAIGDARWQDVKFDPKFDTQKNALSIAEQIKNGINRISANSDVNLVIICIPSQWEGFREYKNDQEVFDLHDHIKAFAIQKGITTQFIEEDTVDNQSQSNRIHWWLSLSFYTKTMRTPWVLENLDKDTAFAGIGYSIDSTEDESHVVMGCSHIYNSRGEGLRYRLAKVDRPVFREKRPHLSYNDAYQFGIATVQLFVEATDQMPKRVVIHKRTFFTDEEKRGILDGLKSIPIVDLIEINIEDDLRFINSLRKQDKFEIDMYPVARGICVEVNSYTGLLYTHGTTQSIRPQGGRDFMGGRGIPAPLVIKKHYGPSSLEAIATEILSLSKMNWNTASLYSKLPATIQSSNDIAKIGSMLSRFSGNSFDYRLFI